MKKLFVGYIRKRYSAIRSIYEIKRLHKSWGTRKSKNIEQRRKSINFALKQIKKPFVKHPSPSKFSLIDNTNNVLEYFDTAEKLFHKHDKVYFDISNVKDFTAASITLLVASIKNPKFHHRAGYSGNAPKNPELEKLFFQSGFYNFVHSRGFKKVSSSNMLHKETNHNVVPEIAEQACMAGERYTFGRVIQFEPLYNILIECMSNTNNHAGSKQGERCNWWLYVLNEPNTNITSYSFLDLGVGIFKSIVVKNYIKQFLKGTVLYRNINLVDDLLSGVIQSRIDEEKEIRGKGIPQIVEYSALQNFKRFYIISNDVKINVKTREKEELKYNLNGTFLYWELQA